MKYYPPRAVTSAVAVFALLFSSCVNYPTLVQVARERAGAGSQSKITPYHITDLDVLNYTDGIKGTLAAKCSRSSLARYGSSVTQTTLTSLAAGADTLGWTVATASKLSLGASYIFSLGQIIDAKGHAQAYEQALSAVQAAEATYYFHQLGMGFTPAADGRFKVTGGDKSGRTDVPSATNYTPDGETLYYRVTKVLHVLDDVLANKIPDLEDLKDAAGESNGKAGSPAKPSGGGNTGSGSSGSGDTGGSSGSSDSGNRPPPPPPTPPPVVTQRSLTINEKVNFTLTDLREQNQTDPTKEAIADALVTAVGITKDTGENAFEALNAYRQGRKKNLAGAKISYSATNLASALDMKLPDWKTQVEKWLGQNNRMLEAASLYVASNDDTTAAALLRALSQPTPAGNTKAAVKLRYYLNTLTLTAKRIKDADAAFLSVIPSWKSL